jgi:hypothetical protein
MEKVLILTDGKRKGGQGKEAISKGRSKRLWEEEAVMHSKVSASVYCWNVELFCITLFLLVWDSALVTAQLWVHF